VRGVQFHPESILTEYGKDMIKNWVNHCRWQKS
jgi:anthranilate synthase component II